MRCQFCGYAVMEGEWLWTDHETGKKICTDCIEEKEGRPPLGLKDLNEIRKRGISKKQYYKELGY